MLYHYVINNDHLGPVDEIELEALFQSGTISDQTLVWREGMASWSPLGSVLPGIVSGTARAENGSPAAASAASTRSYVGFWARVGASIIDGILMSIVGQIVGFVFGFIIGAMMGAAGADEDDIVAVAQFFGFILGTVINWLYYALMESSSHQATLGKMAIGAKVVDASGNRIGFGQATGRYFAKCVSGLLLCIGFMMVGWDERKQGLHDKMAGTFVVRK